MVIRDFWEQAHKSNNLAALSGVPARKAWEMLGVEELVKPDIDVLDIGVGFGQNAQALKDAGCNVTCVDIAEEALQKVEKFASTVHSSRLGDIPHQFHLAMGLNLIQHISGQEFEKHIASIISLLRPDGIYAVETVWSLELTNDKEVHNDREQRLGLCWRTPEFIESAVFKNGGKVVKVLEHHENTKHKVWWCTLHIMNTTP